MKLRRAILSAVVLLLLLGGLVQAQPGEEWMVESGTASDGNYVLTGLAWQVSGVSGGGGYRLLAPAQPALRGSGCCCTYLPLAVRKDK